MAFEVKGEESPSTRRKRIEKRDPNASSIAAYRRNSSRLIEKLQGEFDNCKVENERAIASKHKKRMAKAKKKLEEARKRLEQVKGEQYNFTFEFESKNMYIDRDNDIKKNKRKSHRKRKKKKKEEANGDTKLLKYAAVGNVRKVAKCLRRGTDVNEENNHGHTALFKAALNGHEETVSLLLESGADVFHKDKRRMTALDWTRLSHQTGTEALIEQGILKVLQAKREEDHLRRNEERCRAAFEKNRRLRAEISGALKRGRVDLVIEMGEQASVNFTREIFDQALEVLNIKNEVYFLDLETQMGWTPLTKVAAMGSLEAVQLLLKFGVAVDHETRVGHTALSWAARCGHKEVAAALIMAGAQIDRRSKRENRTPLQHAAANGHPGLTSILLDKISERSYSKELEWKKELKEEIEPKLKPHVAACMKAEELAKVKARWRFLKEANWAVYIEGELNHRDKHGLQAREAAIENGFTDVVALLDSAHGRVQDRRDAMMKEADKAKPKECRNGCGFIDRADCISHHELHQCSLRLVDCELNCGKMIRLNEMEEHLLHHCDKRQVCCLNAYRGCFWRGPLRSQKEHAEIHCKKRLVTCRIGCGKEMVFDQLIHHEQERCGHRLVKCRQECGLWVQGRHVRDHMKNECPHRLVQCSIPQCDMMIRFKDLQDHIDRECSLPCKWDGCGLKIGPKARRDVHELFECGHRMIYCMHGCSAEIPARDFPLHESFCTHRMELCTTGCGEYIRAGLQFTHADPYSGDCPMRMTKCPLDIANKTPIKIRRADGSWEEATVLGYRQEDNRYYIQRKEKAPKTEKGGQEFEWILLQGTRWFPIAELPQSHWKCGEMCACDVPFHLGDAELCRHTPVTCACGQTVPSMALEKHRNEQCPLRWVKCRQGCGKMIQAVNLWDHEKEQCSHRRVLCLCGEFVSIEPNQHAFHMRTCKAGLFQCDLGCGAKIPLIEMKFHTENKCPKRIITCTLGCGETMWAEELEKHVNLQCLERKVGCELCGKAVRAGELTNHQENLCLERLQLCSHGCGAKCAISKIEFHRLYDCPYAFVDCLRGCGEKVRKCDRSWHEKNECMKRLVWCPNDCNTRINADGVEDHLKVCQRAIVLCDYGCGTPLRRQDMKTHTAQCYLRRLPCGAHQKGCERQLRSWIHENKDLETHANRNVERAQTEFDECQKENERAIASEHVKRMAKAAKKLEKAREKLEKMKEKQAVVLNFDPKYRHQVLCERHNETALTYAASSGDHVLVAHIIGIIPPDEIDHESLLGFTALIRACRYDSLNHVRCARTLIENGADPNKETRSGFTPLLEACRYGNFRIIELLTEKRVEIRRKNKHGVEAVSWAKRWGHTDLSEKLRFDHTWMSEQKKLFHLISLNEVDKIKEIVKDGEMYELNARRKYRYKLDRDRAELKIKETELAPKEEQYQKASADVKRTTKAVKDGEALAAHLQKQSIELFAEVKRRNELLEKIRGIAEDALIRLVPRHTEELLEIYEPSPEVFVVLKCILSIMGLEARKRRDPKGTGRMVADWWGTVRKLLKSEDLPSLLRTFNLASLTLEKVKQIRKEFLYVPETYQEWLPSWGLPKDRFKGDFSPNFEYKAGEDGYPLIEAVCKWFVYLDNFWIHRVEVGPIKTRAEELKMEHKVCINKLWKEREEMTRTKTRFDVLIQEYENLKEDSVELTKQIILTEKRLRVAEILQYQTDTGHVPLTWACVCGVPKVVSLLLKHGAMKDHSTDDLHNVSAELIQMYYRNFHWKLTRPPWSVERAYEYRTRGVLFMFRSKLMLRRCREVRMTTRVPLAEACWGGHLDVVQTLNNYKASLINYVSCYMSGAPPFTLPPDILVKKSTPLWLYPLGRGGSDHPLSIIEISRYAMSENGAAEYDKDKGWIPSGHFRCYERISKLYYTADRTRQITRNQILSKKRLKKQGAARDQNLRDMEDAILNSDFQKICALADKGTPIDHAHPETGFTGLMMAAMTEMWVTNSEGHHVLAVELLLDRRKRAPQIDREAANGHTPLTWAAYAGKTMSLDALLRRGANVNYQTKDGKTPLIYAAMNGKPDVVFSLMDHGADVDIVDKDGHGAIWHARERNFTGVVRRLCQLRSGFFGDMIPQSGRVWDKCCTWGCGYTGSTSDVLNHEKSKCPMRIVPCSYCDKEDLWYVEKERHEMEECIKRPVRCGWCKQDVKACNLEAHRDPETGNCPDRVIRCRWNCGKTFRASHQAKHEKSECIHRLIRCSICNMLHEFATKKTDCPKSVTKCTLGCGMETRVEWLKDHETKQCRLRRVRCKWGCDELIIFKDLRIHESDLCTKRCVKCRFACKELIPLDHLEKHERDECEKRFVPCPQGCEIKIRFRDIEQHVKTECGHRMIECPLEGCGEKHRAKDMDEHVKRYCYFRIVPCGLGCGEKMCIRDIEEHKKKFCPKRRTNCPACGITLAVDELEDHRKSKCRLREAFCPAGCGEIIIAQKMKGHMTKYCKMRLVRCRNGCGEMVRFCDRETHETSLCSRSKVTATGEKISTNSILSNMF
eukprot:g4736.t1